MILSMRVGVRFKEVRLRVVGMDRGRWRRGGGLVYRCLGRLGDMMVMVPSLVLGREHLEVGVELILRPDGKIWIEYPLEIGCAQVLWEKKR